MGHLLDIKSCTRCSLGSNTQPNTKIVLSSGNNQARIMIVGEAPGRTEAHAGLPFIGDAGETLNELLALAGIRREDVYVANVCKCWPWKQERNENTGSTYITNRTPERDEIRACLPYLEQEVQILRPRVIIALGGTALNALEGRVSKITERMGIPSLYHTGSDVKDRVYLMPTLHPSYVLRNGGIKNVAGLTAVATQVVSHLKYAVTMLDDQNLYLEHRYMCVDSRAKVEQVIRVLKERRRFSFDIETVDPAKTTGEPSASGLSIKADILGVGIGVDIGVACYIPFWAPPDFGDGLVDFWDDKDISREEVIAALKDVFEDPTILKSAHNAKFDMRGLHKRLGIVVRGLIWDSMCGSYIIDENGSHGLDDLKNKYLDLLGYSDQWDRETNGGKDTWKAQLKTAVNYCCGDCDATYRLTKDQAAVFSTRPSYTWLMDSFYIPIVRLVKKMEYHGVLFDVQRAREMAKEYQAKADELKKKMIQQAGTTFDPDKPKQVEQVLFGVLGLKHDKRTKGKQQSTDKKVLEELAKVHPVPMLITEYRHLCKMKSTYMEGFAADADENGRLHISINPIGTITGRLSSQGLMNIPRESGIKSLIIAPPGHKLVCADLSQAEVRCFAHYANEEVLRQAFAAGKIDVHCLVAAEVAGETYEQFKRIYDEEEAAKKGGPYTERRQAAKGTVFGLLYGRGPGSIAMEYKITFEQAVDFSNKFFQRFPNCKKWIDSTHQLVAKTGEVVNIYGRIRRIPAIFSSDEGIQAEARRQAVNSIIQSTAGDITNLALIEVERRIEESGYNIAILFTVYDSIILEAQDEHVEWTKAMLKECMEAKPHPNFTVNLRADLSVYQQWGISSKDAKK